MQKFLKIKLILLATMTLAHPALAQENNGQNVPGFFETLQDVPLMPGLEELPDLTLSYDKPEGQIIESWAATGALTSSDIESFYQTTLPQLGWRPAGKNSYARQGEYLKLGFEAVEGENFLKITIMPHG